MAKFTHADKILLNEKKVNIKYKLIELLTISIINIKFYIVHCLFMVVLVEAKINYS